MCCSLFLIISGFYSYLVSVLLRLAFLIPIIIIIIIIYLPKKVFPTAESGESLLNSQLWLIKARMQGERASMGSLSEALNFEHGSTSSNPVVDQQIRWENLVDNDLQNYLNTNTNSVYHEQHDLHRFSRAEAPSHNEPWMGTERLEELNPLFISSGNRVVHNVNLNADPVTGHPSLFQVNGVRDGSSVDERRRSCKRKAVDAGIGQSSSNGGERESSSYVSANDLNISLNHGLRGLVPGTVPNLSAPAITEGSSGNFSARVSPTAQVRRPVGPQLMDLRYRHAFGNYTPLNPNASAASMPFPPFQWSGRPVAAGGSSSSAAHIDRNVGYRVETRQRSNMLGNPLYVPPPGHGASSPSSHSEHNQRRLSEHLRRSLLSSLATNQRAARSSVRQSGSDTTFQPQNRAYSRALPRLGQNTNGVPHSLRGRGRLAASEMRRTGTLSLEDVILLSQSMLGAADIQDRYRDIRLDVDNMSYEELLSLEERIGDVCTGLNEDTISTRLKQHKYNSGTTSPQEVEPCCICQDEYTEGEDMGMLECGHGFHSQCIKEWLKRKNLCPICKTTGLNTAEKPIR